MTSVLAFSALYDYIEDDNMPIENRNKLIEVVQHYFPGNDFNHEIKTWDVLLSNKNTCKCILIAFKRWRDNYYKGLTHTQIEKIKIMEKNIIEKYNFM